jgi:hypothetical protein
VSAVPLIVLRIARTCDCVYSVHVIRVSVSVIIRRVAGDLPVVDPQVSNKIRMGQVDAGIGY